MREILAPAALPRTGEETIFLAGSIEMGVAENWQTRTTKILSKTDMIIYNPRRDDWDSSWVQSIDNSQFREQVDWELNALAQAEHILLYFDPNTKSPISLLELGLHAKSGKLRVVCPDGFWRKGNVDIVCHRYAIPQFDTIEDALSSFTTK
jgi:hypothetical protein